MAKENHGTIVCEGKGEVIELFILRMVYQCTCMPNKFGQICRWLICLGNYTQQANYNWNIYVIVRTIEGTIIYGHNNIMHFVYLLYYTIIWFVSYWVLLIPLILIFFKSMGSTTGWIVCGKMGSYSTSGWLYSSSSGVCLGWWYAYVIWACLRTTFVWRKLCVVTCNIKYRAILP